MVLMVIKPSVGVASRVEAWIEMSQDSGRALARPVASRVEAWIEIS